MALTKDTTQCITRSFEANLPHTKTPAGVLAATGEVGAKAHSQVGRTG
jgi:hypothetical protein